MYICVTHFARHGINMSRLNLKIRESHLKHDACVIFYRHLQVYTVPKVIIGLIS